jgi:hypothetical protein
MDRRPAQSFKYAAQSFNYLAQSFNYPAQSFNYPGRDLGGWPIQALSWLEWG